MNKKIHIAHTDEPAPGDVFHPGIILAEELEYRGMKQAGLARLLELNRSDISLVINGRRNMTITLALKLEKALDIPAETWMNLQMRYEIDRARKRITEPTKTAKPQKQSTRRA